MPSDNAYSSIIEKGTKSQVQDGVTPFMRANMTTIARLINILMTAVRVADTTTMYFGNDILRMRSPRVTMA